MTPRLPDRTPWSREQIRAARMVVLPPLLEKRGLTLRERGGGNVEVVQYQGLLLKTSYWRWPDRNLAGNAIDFYVKVLGASFNEAMKVLTQECTRCESEESARPVIAIRPERGYSAAKDDDTAAAAVTAL
jgi:hypothetical protein